jgi:hypothetical protein
MKELYFDAFTLVIAYENYDPDIVFYIDLEHDIYGGQDIIGIDLRDPMPGGDETFLQIQNEWWRFWAVMPLTEEAAIEMRAAFVAMLPDSWAKRKLELTLCQSRPLPRLHARDLFGLFIGQYPELDAAWKVFQEQRVVEITREWLSSDRLQVKVTPSLEKRMNPDPYHQPGLFNEDHNIVTPVGESEEWLKFRASRGQTRPLRVTRIYALKPGLSWKRAGLKPDGVIFSSASAPMSELKAASFLFYYYPDNHPERSWLGEQLYVPLYVLQAPPRLLESLRPTGLLHRRVA